MNKYKVLFDHNDVVSVAKFDGPAPIERLKLSRRNGQQTIEWYIVSADNESEAIRFADTVINYRKEVPAEKHPLFIQCLDWIKRHLFKSNHFIQSK